MQWTNIAAVFFLGGYGLYVWTSFGVTALCLCWEVVAVRRRHAAAIEMAASRE